LVSQRPILIAGAGIAGLAAAIGLSRKGIAVRLLERRPQLSAAGAGIQIGPNGVKALAALGLREAVERVAFKPEALAMFRGATGDVLARLPLGEVAMKRYGAPYLTLLRAELQSCLLDAARAAPNVELTLGFPIEAITLGGDGVTVETDDHRTANGTALIGADGLWSRVRAEIATAEPTPTGYLAYRAVVRRAGLPAPFDAPDIGLWMGREAHIVHYPVGDGALLNLVVVVGGAARIQDWDEPGRLADITPHLARWPVGLAAVLARASDWRCWTLYDLPEPARWTRGAMAITGDAAHPVLPFLAQGAVMALEDAVALANILASAGAPTPAAFAAFERVRRSRVMRLAAASRANGRTYHLSGLPAVARDAVLALMPPERLLGRFDWLYAHDPAALAMP